MIKSQIQLNEFSQGLDRNRRNPNSCVLILVQRRFSRCVKLCVRVKKGQDYLGMALEIWMAFDLKVRIKAKA